MFETRIPIEQNGRLTLVEMTSNLAVAGWDEADVYVRLRDGEEKDLAIEETEAGLSLSARVPCEIKVPYGSPLAIRQVAANLTVKGLKNGLNAEQVRGNLSLKDINEAMLAEVYGNLQASDIPSMRLVGTIFGDASLKGVQNADLQNIRGNLRVKGADQVRVSRTGGNLSAKGIGGNLNADQVGGNALLKGVDGAVTFEQVAGNLVAKQVTGGAKVPKIGGNLVLNGDLGTGRTYHFSARGNATVRLAEDANAHLTLTAKGNLVSSVALADQHKEGNTLTGTLGEGGTEIVVEARGNVVVGGGSGSQAFADLGEEISRQVEESLGAIDFEAIGQQVSQEMDAAMSRLRVKLESVDWDRIGTKTQAAIEQAMERMTHEMERVTEKAAHHQERIQRRAEQEAERAQRVAEREARRAERLARKYQGAATNSQADDVQVEMPVEAVEEVYEPPEPEPDLDEERLSVLRMVEQGQIAPEEAEMLLDALW
jgi:hypothetical protein